MEAAYNNFISHPIESISLMLLTILGAILKDIIKNSMLTIYSKISGKVSKIRAKNVEERKEKIYNLLNDNTFLLLTIHKSIMLTLMSLFLMCCYIGSPLLLQAIVKKSIAQDNAIIMYVSVFSFIALAIITLYSFDRSSTYNSLLASAFKQHMKNKNGGTMATQVGKDHN